MSHPYRTHYRTAPKQSTEALRSIGLAVFMGLIFAASLYLWIYQ